MAINFNDVKVGQKLVLMHEGVKFGWIMDWAEMSRLKYGDVVTVDSIYGADTDMPNVKITEYPHHKELKEGETPVPFHLSIEYFELYKGDVKEAEITPEPKPEVKPEVKPKTTPKKAK